MEAWNPCLEAAWGVMRFLDSIGVQLRVDFDADAVPVLRLRDAQKMLTPGLRAQLMDCREDVTMLFDRYDNWRNGQSPPLRNAEAWTDAVNGLIDWMGFRMGAELSAEFFSECGAMRIVWESRQERRQQ